MRLSLLGFGALALPGCTAFGGLPPSGGVGLGALARQRGWQYGAAVQSWQLDKNDFADALKREAGMLVPETELKWNVLRPSPHEFNFTGYRKLAAFAQANDMAMRGHTLLWHMANPGWLKPALAKGGGEKILETHVKRVLAETAPMIRNWDVVNEAVDVHSPRDDGLRETLWLKALGPDYVATSFRLAHKTDSGLTLVYNDYGTEQGDADGRRKRQNVLRLLEKCKRDKVPVHALGLQSHLIARKPLAGGEFTDFLKEVRALGLKLFITELDLDIRKLVGRTDDKVRLAQNYVRTYLDMAQKDGPIEMLLTWGLSDRYSWLRRNNPDLAGALPLDADFNRGPLWETLKTEWLAA
jgi:endo-1,4-beta-xylanase